VSGDAALAWAFEAAAGAATPTAAAARMVGVGMWERVFDDRRAEEMLADVAVSPLQALLKTSREDSAMGVSIEGDNQQIMLI
jgi:hypothetical protein